MSSPPIRYSNGARRAKRDLTETFPATRFGARSTHVLENRSNRRRASEWQFGCHGVLLTCSPHVANSTFVQGLDTASSEERTPHAFPRSGRCVRRRLYL